MEEGGRPEHFRRVYVEPAVARAHFVAEDYPVVDSFAKCHRAIRSCQYAWGFWVPLTLVVTLVLYFQKIEVLLYFGLRRALEWEIQSKQGGAAQLPVAGYCIGLTPPCTQTLFQADLSELT